jgi:hypothetical protein
VSECPGGSGIGLVWIAMGKLGWMGFADLEGASHFDGCGGGW